MNIEETTQEAKDDFLAIVKAVSVWGIKHKFGSDVDRAFKALLTGDYQEVDHFNFAFEIPRSILDTIFAKYDSESKQTVHLKYGEIVQELKEKGDIVVFNNGGFMQNKKHPCTRFLLNADELKKIFADGNEIKKALRYWDEDSVYTIRQQKLLLKHVMRKKKMSETTEQDRQNTQVFINETQMKIDRNRRLGRAKAKRTKATNERLDALEEKFDALLEQNRQMLQQLAGQKQAVDQTGSFRDFTAEEKKKLMVPMPNITATVVDHNGDEIKVDNSDIDEKSGYDSELLKQFHAKVLDFLEQGKITLGQAKMVCDRMTLMPLEDRRRYKDSVAANEIQDPAARLHVFQSFFRLLQFFINAKHEGKICATQYPSDPSFVKNGTTGEQKLERAYNFAVKQSLAAQREIFTLAGA